ncbi:MAG: rRNA maturation RNase YbeY [Cellvibrionaceae bacterium]
MNLSVDIQVVSDGDDPPDPDSIRCWLRAVLERELPTEQGEVEVSVRLVDRDESQRLNRQYRHKNTPTNVLSFPSELPANLPFRHLGDIVACVPVIREEARQQRKSLNAHWAHMMVHGALHLLGYDHIEDSDAEIMEAREINILAQLDIADPYHSPSIATQQ